LALEVATFAFAVATSPNLAKFAMDFADSAIELAEFAIELADSATDLAEFAIALAEFTLLSSVDLPQESPKLRANRTKNIRINFRFIKFLLKFPKL
jgi:hypothetical protein